MTYDYDIIIIGGGAAGLTAAGLAATLGAKVLLVERDRLGGDCTWAGCVPSKALLRAASVAHSVRGAETFGVRARLETVEFARVMQRVRALREEIYEDADRPEIYHRMGVETAFGPARFVDAHTIEVASEEEMRRTSARYFVIAAGARPATPPIEGLRQVPYLTNETLFELNEQPRRLAIVGAGPIGIEMAQAFRRLGTDVVVLEQGGRILPRDDEENVALLQHVLEDEGVRVSFDAAVAAVAREGAGLRLEVDYRGEAETVVTDALLVATGRQPNVEALNLDAAGIDFSPKGIEVDDRCRTSVRHIFAAGDVTGRYYFTHMSEHMAKVAVTNALMKWPQKIDTRRVPWVTYTDPELAQVGATAAELEEQGERFEIFRFPLSKVDRAITDGKTRGLVKVYARKRSGKILGASVVAPRAGDVAGELALAMRHGISLRQIADTIHPYPTYALGLRRAADQWYIRNFSTRLVGLAQKVFRYRGTVRGFEEGEIV